MTERRFKILVVDDNAQNRLAISDTLEAEGFEIVEAEDRFAAITAFQAHSPDCILMDARMPGLDGFGACARIRALPGGPETPSSSSPRCAISRRLTRPSARAPTTSSPSPSTSPSS
jgi:CheY-like chemotaxis protein